MSDADDRGCFVVIFTSTLHPEQLGDDSEYAAAARRMEELASRQPGFISMESLRQGARGLTISCWQDREAIARWRRHPEHRAAIERGRTRWYRDYEVRICRLEREYRSPTRCGGE